jgi:hypothetical protein
MSSYYSDAGIPKSSPGFLQWVKGMGSINRAQQQTSMQHQSYNPNNTYNRIFVDVVIIQRVVEYELASYRKQRTVNNLVMGALLPADELTVWEERVQSEYADTRRQNIVLMALRIKK